MSAAALLAELDAEGVRLSLAGDDLHFETRPGVSIATYREQITAHKPALLAALRQRELDAEVALLERGWAWLEAHPDDPKHDEFEARWIERLRQYERSYSEAVSGGREPMPRRTGTDFGRSPGSTTPSSPEGLTGEPTGPKTTPVPSPTDQNEPPTT